VPLLFVARAASVCDASSFPSLSGGSTRIYTAPPSLMNPLSSLQAGRQAGRQSPALGLGAATPAHPSLFHELRLTAPIISDVHSSCSSLYSVLDQDRDGRLSPWTWAVSSCNKGRICCQPSAYPILGHCDGGASCLGGRCPPT